jgi:hypothetical protein
MQEQDLIATRWTRQEAEIGDGLPRAHGLRQRTVAMHESRVSKINIVARLRHRRKILFFVRGRQLQRSARLRRQSLSAEE